MTIDGVRRWALGSLGLAALARLIAGPLPLNYYDVGYALVWGREILRGQLPAYRTPGASTPHPLGTLLGTLAALFGSPGAWYVVELILFVSLGVVGAALFGLTRLCIGRALGREDPVDSGRATGGAVLAVGALLLSPPFLTDALGGSGLSDMPALALVLAAAALAAARPERSRGPLVLLGLAGLMRPEAWGLAGAYWLYLVLDRRSRIELAQGAVLVLAAPVLWGLCDLIVVGDPTYSLSHTQAASQTGTFAHGLGQVPSATARGLRALVGVPVLAVGILGGLTALAVARRAMAPALALLGLALGEFAALGLADVPLLERFLLIVAAMVCLFFAYAVVAGGDQVLARTGRGRSWVGAAWSVGATVVVIYVAAAHLTGDAHVRRNQQAGVHAEADLVSLASRSAVRGALRRCPGFYVPRFTLTSLVAYDFNLPPQAIRRTSARPPLSGLVLAPVTVAAGVYFGVTPARLRVLRRTLVSSIPVSQNRSWRLVARGCAAV